MKIKITIILFALLLTTVSIACAGERGGRHGGKNRMDKITQELNLTPEQASQFKAVKEKRKVKMRQSMDSIHAETNAELAKFLTKEQMQIIKEKKGQRRMHKSK